MPEAEEEGQQQGLQSKESGLLAGAVRLSPAVEAYPPELSETMEAEDKGEEEPG